METNNYFAKCTWPIGLDWKTPWTEKASAVSKAQRFLHDWRDIGTLVEVTVFYRDGSTLCRFDARKGLNLFLTP